MIERATMFFLRNGGAAALIERFAGCPSPPVKSIHHTDPFVKEA
jgi:hypothetical protein